MKRNHVTTAVVSFIACLSVVSFARTRADEAPHFVRATVPNSGEVPATHQSQAGDPAGFYSNDFNLHAVEYWGRGGYAGGDEVSFGFRTNGKAWNQECARLTHAELQRALELNAPEMQALASVDGPTGIYIIISDFTRPGQRASDGAVWHYAAEETGQGGLIKFHANVYKNEDGSFTCSYPTAAQLFAFAARKKDEIDGALRLQAAARATEAASEEVDPGFAYEEPAGEPDPQPSEPSAAEAPPAPSEPAPAPAPATASH